MSFKLGQLVIELAANTARLQSDMGKAVGIVERGAAQFKKAFSFVTAGAGGGLIGVALVSAAKQAIQFGDEIAKAATKSGIGGKAMSELAYAAKLADVDIGSLSVALKKMQVAVSEAGTGSKQAQGALAALGLTFEQVQKRKPEAQFELIADRISKLTDPADRARAATELFGKAGADLLPLFEQGAKGIAKAVAEARKLGLSFSDDDLNKLSTADESIKRLSASWSGFATTLTAEVAPALSGILDKLSGIDTRSQEEKIKALTADIQSRRGFGLGGGVGGRSAAEEAAAYEEIAHMRGMIDLQQVRSLQTGTSGGPTNRRDFGAAIGFARADAAAKAAEAAQKAADAEEKSYQEMNARILANYESMTGDMIALDQEQTDEWIQGEVDREKMAQEFADKQKELEADVAKWREQQVSASARFFKDTFLQAFDDWINTGKFKFDQFLKYVAAEWSRKWIANAFDGLTSNGASGSSGGWLSSIGNAIGSLFGGGSSSIDGKAGGGGVNAGQTYLVGEKGMELFRPRASGDIVPNHALGGNVVSIDASLTINGGANGVSRGELEAAQREQTRRIFDEMDRRGITRLAA